MDSILSNVFLIGEEEPSMSRSEESPKKSSIWLVNKDIIQPSADVSIVAKLPSGVYIVDSDREGMFCKKVEIKTDDLYKFSDSIIENLVDEISTFWDKKEIYKQNKLVHKRGILLEGYPGTGKTSVITLITKEIINKGGVVFKVSGPRNFLTYTEFLQHYFRKIEPETPVVTIIEDIDKYEDVEIEILDFLDGKSQIDHHVIITTSNNTEEIPDTFLRPSRLDLHIEIPLPNEEIRREYFIKKNIPEDKLDEIITETDNMSLADLKELYICVFVLDYTIEDAVEKIRSPRTKKNYLSANKKPTSLL